MRLALRRVARHQGRGLYFRREGMLSVMGGLLSVMRWVAGCLTAFLCNVAVPVRTLEMELANAH